MLSNRFRKSVDKRLDNITQNPELFPFDVSPIRFAKIGRFPYLIFFVVKPEFISIIAIVHGAADPNKWRSRK
jgi:plasmid stabilization system protein ParE